MNILYNILAVLFCLLVGYFFGGIPTSIWVGKLFYHQDPREYGSHNPGGTNAGRLWGKKVGFAIILFDMFKAIFPMWLCWVLFTFIPFRGQPLCPMITNVNQFGFNPSYIIPWPVYWCSALGCMIGHCWPVFAEFKGGKGVSVIMGICTCSSWMLGFIPGLLYFLILKITKHVSTASIITPVIFSFVSWIWAILMMTGAIPESLYALPMYGPTLLPSWIYATLISVLSLFVIFRHHENIKRLKEGTERKITWMK